MSKNVVVVAVHPDDETLGCGGTILWHKARSDNVFCIWVTNGNEKQKLAIPSLQEIYKFQKFFTLDLPDTKLNTVSLTLLIDLLADIFHNIKANIIYLPNRSDPHSDHRYVFDACQACTKSFRFPQIEKVMMMEVISETDFSPTLPENIFMPHIFVDISHTFENKINALNCFPDELLEYPMTRNISAIEAHNRYRGSQINTEYAESFMLLKEIIK